MDADGWATYEDIMADLANDRDDSNDPEFRDPEGYCEHGMYVGGCGIDWMCELCESGISMAEYRKLEAQRKRREQREAARRRTALRMRAAELGYKLSDLVPPEYVKKI